ncbi:hypothetical protein [Hymenobacter daeguensis]
MSRLYFTLVFLLGALCCQAQEAATYDVSYKGDLLIISGREETLSLTDEKAYALSELRLNKAARSKLAAGLRKGLEWADINSSRNLTFRKLVTEIPSTAYTSRGNGHSYTGTVLMFSGSPAGEYTMYLLGDTRDVIAQRVKTNSGYKTVYARKPFDIDDSTGFGIFYFHNANEVNNFIRLLTAQHENLDEIFK